MANIPIETITKNNDGNTYVIKDANAIPKAGGAVLEGQEFKRTVDNSTLNVYGGNGYSHGAFLQLCGRDEVGAGDFNIQAHDGNTATILKGKANGTLTWGDKEIETIEEQGNNYIRYSSGLQICWGEYEKTTETDLTINFPKAFIYGHPLSISVSGQSSTIHEIGWNYTRVIIGNTNAGAFTYTAVGTWK